MKFRRGLDRDIQDWIAEMMQERPAGIDMLGACMEVGIFRKSKGGLIVREERGRMWLGKINFSGKHLEPHAFTCSFRAGNILGIAG
jgi:hypothetical protein